MRKNSWLWGAWLCASLLTFQLVAPSALAQRGPHAAVSQKPRPQARLVIGIMIDQFRADYLVRFADQFAAGGLHRLLTHGAVFTNTHYTHTPTYTACGHATFMSGATPSETGIISNEWFDRETGHRVTSVSDANVKLLGGPTNATAASPTKLIGTTLGDEMRFASNGQAKVIGISFKDRSAILPAGKHPNAAYWFNNITGTFVSSTYYFNELPEWVKKFNHDVRPDRYFGAKWEKLLPQDAYQRSRPDNAPEERGTFGNTFPYIINGGETKPGPKFYQQFEKTPFANEYTIEFAKAAIENEALGMDETTDMLTISFSPNDLVGHEYGPYSQETQDMTLRTDKLLADFFNYIDRRIGLNRVIIVLSADHGVAPIPEWTRQMGFGGRIENKAIMGAIEAALDLRFGAEDWVRHFVYNNIYLDEAAIERRKVNHKDVEQIACASTLKISGIAACYTHTELLTGELPRNRIAESVARGFYPSRNGNLIVIPHPFFLSGDGATTHGTPYPYDTHVPMIFFGQGIAPGSHMREASPIDIAPTLAAILGLTPPSNSEGHVLVEVFK